MVQVLLENIFNTKINQKRTLLKGVNRKKVNLLPSLTTCQGSNPVCNAVTELPRSLTAPLNRKMETSRIRGRIIRVKFLIVTPDYRPLSL